MGGTRICAGATIAFNKEGLPFFKWVIFSEMGKRG